MQKGGWRSEPGGKTNPSVYIEYKILTHQGVVLNNDHKQEIEHK